jgi:hypothetical protein
LTASLPAEFGYGVRTSLAVFAGLILAAGSNPAAAQTFLINNAPAVTVRTAADFATTAIGDPWDFDQASDYVYMLSGPAGSWPGVPTVSGGIFSGRTNAAAPNLQMLFEGIGGGMNTVDKTGIRYPIDSRRFRYLTFRMRRSVAARNGELIGASFFTEVGRIQANLGHAMGDSAGFNRNGAMVNQSPLGQQGSTGWHIYRIDLGAPAVAVSAPWFNATRGHVRGLLLAAGSGVAGATIEIDWVRLVEAAPITLTLSGFSGNVTITASNPASGDVVQVYNPGASTFVNGNVVWDYGHLPPGVWTLTATGSGGGTASATLDIRPPPVITVLDPDVGGGRDFAETVVSDAWDLTNPQDLRTGRLWAASNATFNEAGVTALSTSNDPKVLLTDDWDDHPGTELVIDATRFHRLTFTIDYDHKELDFSQALSGTWGGHARVAWTTPVRDSLWTQTHGFVVMDGGPVTYSLDLAALVPGDGSNPFHTLCHQPPNCAAHHPWGGAVSTFSVEAHEATAPRWFRVANVKLAEDDQANGNGYFLIRWGTTYATFGGGSTPGLTAGMNLYYDTDTTPGGHQPIAAGVNAAAGAAWWDVKGLAPGLYYVLAEVADAAGNYQLRYSTGPVRVTGGYATRAAWNALHGVSAPGGDEDADGVPNDSEYVLGTSPRLSNRWVLSEGATGWFTERIALANPDAAPATVVVRFLPNGAGPVFRRYTVPGFGRGTINVNEVAGLASKTVAAEINVETGAVVAERTMFLGPTAHGGHTGKALVAPAHQWYLAEGFGGAPFDTFILFTNTTGAPTTVTTDYLLEGGQPPIRHQFTLNANDRQTIHANSLNVGGRTLAGRAFSASISSTPHPITVERAMYFSTGGRFWNGAHASAAIAQPSSTWYVAEGKTGRFFDTFLLFANPNPFPVNVAVNYLTSTGSVAENFTIPQFARFPRWLDSLPGLADAEVSAAISANGNILVERAMYWPGGVWTDGHNSAGVTRASTYWAFAEGALGGPLAFNTFLLLANPTGANATVTLTLLRTNRPPVATTVTVPAGRRVTHAVSNLGLGLASGELFGAVVTSNVPIVVERAMYWNGGGEALGGGTNEVGVPLR